MSNLSMRGKRDFAYKPIGKAIAENGVYHFQIFATFWYGGTAGKLKH